MLKFAPVVRRIWCFVSCLWPRPLKAAESSIGPQWGITEGLHSSSPSTKTNAPSKEATRTNFYSLGGCSWGSNAEFHPSKGNGNTAVDARETPIERRSLSVWGFIDEWTPTYVPIYTLVLQREVFIVSSYSAVLSPLSTSLSVLNGGWSYFAAGLWNSAHWLHLHI